MISVWKCIDSGSSYDEHLEECDYCGGENICTIMALEESRKAAEWNQKLGELTEEQYRYIFIDKEVP